MTTLYYEYVRESVYLACDRDANIIGGISHESARRSAPVVHTELNYAEGHRRRGPVFPC